MIISNLGNPLHAFPVHTALSALGLLLVLALPAHSQTIEGLLIDAERELPVAGGFIGVFPEGRESAVATTLSRDDGSFGLRGLVPGRYQVRAQRIGFASATASVEVDEGGRAYLEIPMTTTAIRLEEIRVEGTRRCRPHPMRGPEMAILWEAARAAFAGTLETEEEGTARFHVLRYQRELEESRLRVESEQRQFRTLWGSNPIHSVEAERLAAEGYVHPNPEGDVYYAPDASVLLSESFLEDHCFHIAEDPEEPGIVGLAFEPVRGRRLPDIRGTLWVDRKTAELQHLDFVYVNLPYRISSDRIGGRVEFERLPTGAWVIPSWWIRMPTLALRQPHGFGEPPPGGREMVIDGYRQVGGEIRDIRIAGEDHQLFRTGSGTLAGVVRDELADGAALAGARVFLPGTPHSAVTGADGTFRIDSVSAGVYGISFSHPRLDSLAADPPHEEVTVAVDSTSQLTLSLSEAHLPRCAAEHTLSGGGSVRVIGYVREDRTEMPLAGAQVTVALDRWGVHQGRHVAVSRDRRGVQVTTDRQGRYQICGLPRQHLLQIDAAYLGRESGRDTVEVLRTRVLRHDIHLDLARTIRVRGRVLSVTTGQPVRNAVVEIEGTGQRTQTDARGRWSMDGVVPDRHALSVRHLGHGTHRQEVVIAAEEIAELEIRLPDGAIPIDTMVVVGYSSPERARRMSGTRHDVMARTDIEELGGRTANALDLVRRGFLSLEVTESSGTGAPAACVQGRRGPDTFREFHGCREVLLYVDGVRVTAPSLYLKHLGTDEVESVEYVPPVLAGSRYGGNSARGVLVVYTRGNGPHAVRDR